MALSLENYLFEYVETELIYIKIKYTENVENVDINLAASPQ